MNIKIAILSLTLTFTSLANSTPAGASVDSSVEIGIGDKDKKRKKAHRKTPSRLNEGIMDNARKRSRNHQFMAYENQSRKKKYTRSMAPVNNARFDAKNWEKPSKWTQKRLPKAGEETETGPVETTK